MKKIAHFILEANALSFKWYCAIIVTLIFINLFNIKFFENLGISWQRIAWFLTISLLLKIYYHRVAVLRYGQFLKQKTAQRNIVFIFLLVSIIVWGIKYYPDSATAYRVINGAGIPPMVTISIIFLLYCCCLIDIFMASKKSHTKNVPENQPTIKELYRLREEAIATERLSAQNPIRRFVHETEYTTLVAWAEKCGGSILDIGCGDGTAAVMLASKGLAVTACDISPKNIKRARRYAINAGYAAAITFLVADAENLPFPDNSFNCVISSHVLEHLPDFHKGLAEIHRIVKKRAIIAMPTCLSPCAMVILGGDSFWAISRWTPIAWCIGLARIILNFGGEGVNEHYGGDDRLPHLWRYPWVMKRQLREAGFAIIHFEASSLCVPYCAGALPFIKKLNIYKSKPIIRNFGYGSIAVVEK